MIIVMMQKISVDLHKTCNSMASLILLWRASFVPWQAIFTPFMSCVMLSFTWVDEIFPPHKPAWFVTPPSLIKGIPSLYQLKRTGGLLELESQNKLASVPAVNALGSMRIFKVSGKTVNKKSFFRKKLGKMGEKHHHNDDNERREQKKRRKSFLLFGEKLPIEPNTNNQADTKNPPAGAVSSCRKFNQILKISSASFFIFFLGKKVLFVERYTVELHNGVGVSWAIQA